MNNNVFIVYISKNSEIEHIYPCATRDSAADVIKKRLAKLMEDGYIIDGKAPDDFEITHCSSSQKSVIKLYLKTFPDSKAEIGIGMHEVISSRYRSREEEILHFKSLSYTLEKDAKECGNDPILLAKAEVYRLAALDIEENTTEGWRS